MNILQHLNTFAFKYVFKYIFVFRIVFIIFFILMYLNKTYLKTMFISFTKYYFGLFINIICKFSYITMGI